MYFYIHQNIMKSLWNFEGLRRILLKNKKIPLMSAIIAFTLLNTAKLSAQCDEIRDTLYRTLVYHPDTQVPDDVKQWLWEKNTKALERMTDNEWKSKVVKITHESLPNDIAETFNELDNTSYINGEITVALDGESPVFISEEQSERLAEYTSEIRKKNMSDEVEFIVPNHYEKNSLTYWYDSNATDAEKVTSIVKTKYVDPNHPKYVSLENEIDSLNATTSFEKTSIHEWAHNLWMIHENSKEISNENWEVILSTLWTWWWLSVVHTVPYFTETWFILDSINVSGQTLYNVDLSHPDVPWNVDIMKGNLEHIFSLNPYVCQNMTSNDNIEYNTTSDITLYPNPVSETLHIDINSSYSARWSQYVIYDTTGKLRKTWTLTSDNNSLDVHNLPWWSYIFTIQNQQTAHSQKFIKID